MRKIFDSKLIDEFTVTEAPEISEINFDISIPLGENITAIQYYVEDGRKNIYFCSDKEAKEIIEKFLNK